MNPPAIEAEPRSASRAPRWVATAVFHAALAIALFALKAPKREAEIVTFEVVDAKEKKKPKPPPPQPPAPAAAPAAPPPPSPSPRERAPARPSPLGPMGDAEPASGTGPAGGLEIPQYSNEPVSPSGPSPSTAQPTPTATQTVQKTLGPPPAAPSECGDPLQKPKPKGVPQPAYPQAARDAEIQGKVRIEVVVDERGAVSSARVVSGLGHGLDEAALSAARAATFEPATRCGKPVSATFVIGIRFTL